MDVVHTQLLMDQYILENIKMVKNMVKVYLLGLMVVVMKGNLKMENLVDMAFMYLKMVMYMLVTLKMMNLMGWVDGVQLKKIFTMVISN